MFSREVARYRRPGASSIQHRQMLGQVALPCREAWWGNFHITHLLYKHPVVLLCSCATSGKEEANDQGVPIYLARPGYRQGKRQRRGVRSACVGGCRLATANLLRHYSRKWAWPPRLCVVRTGLHVRRSTHGTAALPRRYRVCVNSEGGRGLRLYWAFGQESTTSLLAGLGARKCTSV